MKVLVIIPAYNESGNIENTVEMLKKKCPEVDYLVINDCSTDNTKAILKERQYNYLDLPINLGIGGGVQAGYKYAVEKDYDIAIQYDGDGQHNAEYIPQLIHTITEKKTDMVIGSRFIDKKGFQTSFMRRVGINIINGVIHVCTGNKITDATSGFRAIGKELTCFFSKNYAQDYPEPEAIVAAIKNGFTVTEIPVVMNERTEGVSSINLVKSFYYMVKVVLAILLQTVVFKKGRN